MIANFLLRPYRQNYKIEDLGPSVFMMRNKIYERQDF